MAYFISHTKHKRTVRSVHTLQARRRPLTFHNGRTVLWWTGAFTLLVLLLGETQKCVFPVTALDGSVYALEIPFLSSRSNGAAYENAATPAASHSDNNIDVNRVLAQLHRRAPVLSLFGWNLASDEYGAPSTGKHREEASDEQKPAASVKNSNSDSTVEVPTDLGQPSDNAGEQSELKEGFEAERNEETFKSEGGKQVHQDEPTSETPDTPEDETEEGESVTPGEGITRVLQEKNNVVTESDYGLLLDVSTNEKLENTKGAWEHKKVDTRTSVENPQLSTVVDQSAEQVRSSGIHSSRELASCDSDVFEGHPEVVDPQPISEAASECSGAGGGHEGDSGPGEPSRPGYTEETEGQVMARDMQCQKKDEQVVVDSDKKAGKIRQVHQHREDSAELSHTLGGSGDWIPLSEGHSHGAGGTHGKPVRRLAGHKGEAIYGEVPFDEDLSAEADPRGDMSIGENWSREAVDFQYFSLYDDSDELSFPSVSLGEDDVSEEGVTDGVLPGTEGFDNAQGYQFPPDSETDETPSEWGEVTTLERHLQNSELPNHDDDPETGRLANYTANETYAYFPFDEDSGAEEGTAGHDFIGKTGRLSDYTANEIYGYFPFDKDSGAKDGTTGHEFISDGELPDGSESENTWYDHSVYSFLNSDLKDFERDDGYEVTGTLDREQGHQPPFEYYFTGEHEAYEGSSVDPEVDHDKDVSIDTPETDPSAAARLLKGELPDPYNGQPTEMEGREELGLVSPGLWSTPSNDNTDNPFEFFDHLDSDTSSSVFTPSLHSHSNFFDEIDSLPEDFFQEDLEVSPGYRNWPRPGSLYYYITPKEGMDYSVDSTPGPDAE